MNLVRLAFLGARLACAPLSAAQDGYPAKVKSYR